MSVNWPLICEDTGLFAVGTQGGGSRPALREPGAGPSGVPDTFTRCGDHTHVLIDGSRCAARRASGQFDDGRHAVRPTPAVLLLHASTALCAHGRLPCVSMVAWSVGREHRPAPRAATALVVLLAALLHLLGCAHGPAASEVARADTPLLVTATCGPTCTPATSSDMPPAPAPGEGRAHCWDGDEPTVQPPRGVSSPVPGVDVTAPSAGEGGRLSPARTGPPVESAPGPATAGRARARLGVWRS
jgi:hypothetical protein